MNNSHIDCPSEDLLALYVDGQLAEWDAAGLEEHLAACNQCAARVHELDRFRAMWEALRGPAPLFPGLEAPPVEDAALERLAEGLGGRIWAAARLVWGLSARIPELIPSPAFPDSPFGAFAAATTGPSPPRMRGAPVPHTPVALARASGRGGSQNLEISYDENSGNIVVLLSGWTGGPPPRVVFQRLPAEPPRPVAWVELRPGDFRAEFPAAEPAAELVLAFGPR